MTEACLNTDKEIWREPHRGAYGSKIHVTAHGGIGINVGGEVIVAPVEKWHEAGSRLFSVDPKLSSWRRWLAYKLLGWE